MAEVSVRFHEDGNKLVTLSYAVVDADHVGKWLKDYVGDGAIDVMHKWFSMGRFAAEFIANHGGRIVADDDAQYVYNVYRFPNGQIGMRVYNGGEEVYYGRVKDFTLPGGVGGEAKSIADALGGRYTVLCTNASRRQFVVTAKV